MSAGKSVKLGDCRKTPSELLVAQALGNAQTTCILEELNKIYEARLRDIDENAKGDLKPLYVMCLPCARHSNSNSSEPFMHYISNIFVNDYSQIIDEANLSRLREAGEPCHSAYLKYRGTMWCPPGEVLKCITYQEWVDMLMRTMRHMLETLHVLENQASSRINLLERKLRIDCKIDHTTDSEKLKCDLANLLELIRRAVEDKKWNTDGLQFKTITVQDIFQESIHKCDNTTGEDVQKLNSQIICQNQMIKKLESERNSLRTELDVKDLQLKKLNAPCTSKRKPTKTEICAPKPTEEDAVFKACISELRKDMREKECQLEQTLKENECLKSELTLVKSQVTQKDKVITNIRALTIEVADKHDQIQQMRTQMFSLEEDLKKAEKKIQFKDNVIKELRRDCKNASKNCTCSKSSISPRTRSPSPDKSETQKPSSSRSGKTMSQSTCSDYILDTVVALESNKLQCAQIEENQRIKMLQKELNDLFNIHSTHEGNMEENRKTITRQQKRVQELMQQLFCDLYDSRNRLAFIRNRLMSINSAAPVDSCGIDSGYTSQEDVEPEGKIINTIKNRMQSLSEENKQLKCKMQQVEQDVESFKTTASSCGHILKEVASTISAMIHKDITCDYSDEEQLKVNPLQEALATLSCDLSEKDSQIADLTKIKEELEKELQCFKSTNCVLHHESNAKDQTIFDLQDTIDYQDSSIKVLQELQEKLESNLCKTKQTDVHKKLTQLLNDKAKLESECQNQLTTISNLRQALESHKRGSGPGASASGASSSGGSNASIWGWFRNPVHDV